MNLSVMISIFSVATFVSVVAYVVARLVRHRAGLSHGILLTGLGLVVVSPLIGLNVPKSIEFKFPSPNALAISHETSTALEAAASPLNKLGSADKNHSAIQHDADSSQNISKLTVGLRSNSKLNPQQATSSPVLDTAGHMEKRAMSAPWLLALALASGWLTVAGLLLLRLGFQLTSLYAVFRRPVECDETKLKAAFSSAKLRVKQTDDVRLGWGNVAGPVAMSWPHRLVVVPHGFGENVEQDSIRRIFTHELAHVRRYDQLALLFQRILARACCGLSFQYTS